MKHKMTALVDYKGTEYVVSLMLEETTSLDRARNMVFDEIEERDGVELPRDIMVDWVPGGI